MKLPRLLLFLASLLLVGTSFAARAQDLKKLTYLTEDFPPYNFQVDGVPQGISVDLLVKALKQAHAGVERRDIHVWPWARSYQMLLHEPDIVLFSTYLTQHRKPLFKWVGPITESHVVLLAKKSAHIVIHSPKDIRHYTIGVIRSDVGEQLVKSLGVPSSHIVATADGANVARMLASGRVDLWAYDQLVALWFLKKAGFDTSRYEPVYVLHRGDLYYAVSKSTSDKLVDALQRAVDRVKNEDGGAVYKAIIDKYR